MSDPETRAEAKQNSRRQLLEAGLGVAAAAGLGAVGLGIGKLYRGPRGESPPRIMAQAVQELPVDDPLHKLWADLPAFKVVLTPQQLSAPFLKVSSIHELVVRSAHDGERIAFHLEWADPARDELEVVDRFRDAVALMIPLQPGKLPPVTMGSVEQPVYLLHWKASWQAGLRGARGLDRFFPNTTTDILPETILDEKTAGSYYPAVAMGNPMVAAGAASAVEEAVAQGFGTVSSLPTQQATGKGVYHEGAWHVTIALPMRGGAGRPTFAPGETQQVAFAVWNGADGNVGGRKQYASWQPVEVEGAQA